MITLLVRRGESVAFVTSPGWPTTGKLDLYGRGYCHLCEEMARPCRRSASASTRGRRRQRPGLDERYGEHVPVLLKDGVEICRHRLTPEAIAQLS